MKTLLNLPLLVCLGLLTVPQMAQAKTYHVDNEATWKKVTQRDGVTLKAGDQLHLKRGTVFSGKLRIRAKGKAENPIIVGAYGEGAAPVIDASGYFAGIQIVNSQHLTVQDIEIVADGGKPKDGADPKKRYGVIVESINAGKSTHIVLANLRIHDVYSHQGAAHEGQNETTHIGTAITVKGGKGDKAATDITVKNCHIERTGFKAIELRNVKRALVLDNYMKDIGGPAIQPGVVEDLIVRGNTVDGSGSSLDPRMHGRGSGIWPWTSKNVLIEKNSFMHARGKSDSCGVHIDFNCSDVIVQYNLSVDNEGGFVEILGNCFNSAYRYNISINDGARVKGQNGAHQEGKVLWTSGFVGRKKTKVGPDNSYIYNNTIYVGPDSRSCFSITGTTNGLLIANNIFHIMGETVNVLGDQDWRKDKTVKRLARTDVRNNVYLHADILPKNLPYEDLNALIGDPQFANPGGLDPKDYIPGNGDLIKDKGIQISQLAGDDIGLRIGLELKSDFFGNPIEGLPDVGAIEIPSHSH